MLKEFKNFIMTGNVIDFAVAVIMAGALGAVMSPQYFGTTGFVSAPFDGGRTKTHEVGHWMNLRHYKILKFF